MSEQPEVTTPVMDPKEFDLFDEEKLSKKLVKLLKKVGLKPLLKLLEPLVGEKTAERIKNWVDDHTPNAQRAIQRVLAKCEDGLVHLIYGMKQEEVDKLTEIGRRTIREKNAIVIVALLIIAVETLILIFG